MKKYIFGAAVFINLIAGAFSPGVAVGAAAHRAACSRSVGAFHCHARLKTDQTSGKPIANSAAIDGLTPSDLHDAYKLPAISRGNFVWNGQTVAVVDAYHNPNAASDLTVYRRQFGLPMCGDGGVGCLFSQVNQSGKSSPMPASNTGWGQEENLDIQMVAAVCPTCKIVLVEATSASIANLGTAVNTATKLGANAISNSYGGSEFAGELAASESYNHPGLAITVSSGDSGYGTEFPASSQYVTAVGGTSLSRSSNSRGWTETTWSGAGSGCSSYIPRPTWQPAIGACTKRSVADISAVADPATGLAVYDSYGSSGGNNWYVIGGTSASAPIIAGIYAQAMATNHLTIKYSELPYGHSSSLFDITVGKNGSCGTKAKLLCTAGTNYDGPTGLGTPNGLGAF